MPHSMVEASPQDVEWLSQLVRRSPILHDKAIRRHWQKIIPWLSLEHRYVLAAILMEIENACSM